MSMKKTLIGLGLVAASGAALALPNIAVLATGGTIAGAGASATGTAYQAGKVSVNHLVAAVPELANIANVTPKQVAQIGSQDMSDEVWLKLAQTINADCKKYDGFVISHGTDAMAYTAAALSYLVQGSPKPIVLTGAQKPIWFDGTDSKRNLTDAFLYACRGCGGVQIVFNGKVILGTRARKTCSKSYHAFSSVNYPDLAVVQDGRLLQYMRCTCYPRPVFYNTLDDRVSLLKLIPGTRRELLAFMADHYDGLVIEGFGVGGLPEYDGFYDVVRQAAEAGKLIVMTTQVPNEGSDLTVYHVGGRLKSTCLLYTSDAADEL